jgi:hypothetical protein
MFKVCPRCLDATSDMQCKTCGEVLPVAYDDTEEGVAKMYSDVLPRGSKVTAKKLGSGAFKVEVELENKTLHGVIIDD